MSIFNYLKKEKFDIICLQETHISNNEAHVWERQFGGKLFYQEGSNNGRGEMIMFSKHFKGAFEVVVNQDRICVLSVKSDAFSFYLVNVYAPASKQDKILFFARLKETLQDIGDENYVLLGDFNSVINNEFDIISGNPHDKNEVECFKETISGLGLYDTWRIFHSNEKDFTWLKHNPMIARRLDYCFVNENVLPWLVSCEHAIVPNTDHKAVFIELNDTSFVRGPGYWKFNNSYLKDADFVQEFNLYVEQMLQNEISGLSAVDKWEFCKINIKEFCINYGKVKSLMRKQETYYLEKELKETENKMILNPTDTELNAKHCYLKQKLELQKIHEAKGAQVRSKVKWIEDGEKNTKYFYNLEKTRAKHNIITRLEDQDGQIITEQGLILKKQVDYFSSLYNQRTEDNNTPQAVTTFLNNENFPRLSEEEADSCEGEITLQEASYALSQMKNGSSPGSDGLTVDFMKFFWGKIGQLVINSFLEAYDKGELSYTQKKGIIILLHKGKDLQREKLNNWRPITLTNTDYKILAKVLALRMSTVVQKLINEDQVGYLKGRSIATVLRTIDDVIQYLNTTGKAGYLVALDYAKAFDSVSKDFLLHTFEVFGFGNEFQKWVKVLTKSSNSCINYGGWLSESFDVFCGIRQGCPFSPLAFVLSVELLAIKIRNSSINGIPIPSSGQNNNNNKLKIKQLADDTTLFLTDRQDMTQALQIINRFSRFSGLKLNVDKTNAMAIGAQRDENNLPFNSTKQIKILGIYFNNSVMASHIEENWVLRIDKLHNLIKTWSMRDLSIHGKILLVKTFMISQFTFVMQSVGLPESVLLKINRLLYKFVWQRRFSNKKAFEKVKRKVMQSDFENGGLRMVDMCKLQTIYYLQWAGKIVAMKNENWTVIPQWHLSQIASKFLAFDFNCRSKKAKCIHVIRNEFWERVLIEYLNNKTLVEKEEIIASDIGNQIIFNNKVIQYKGRTLYFKNWKDKGIELLKDVMHVTEKRLLTLEEIKLLVGRNLASTCFEYNALVNAIPKSWLENIIVDESEAEHTQIKDIELFNSKPKLIKAVIENNPDADIVIPRCIGFWRQKHNFEIGKSEWLMSRIATKEIRLRELQWKIIHNIYPTNILLHKMKVVDSKDCSFCRNTIDYIEHFFYECGQVKPLWEHIENLLMVHVQRRIKLSLQTVMFGMNKNDLSVDEFEYVNHILLIGKMCISIVKKTKNTLSICALFDYHMELRRL